MRRKARTIGVLAKSFTIEILEAVSKKPRRFTDLKQACPNASTRATRLRELRRGGFIRSIILEIGEQSFIHFTITDKGKNALQLLQQLEKLSKS